jgi:hypothetical protein
MTIGFSSVVEGAELSNFGLQEIEEGWETVYKRNVDYSDGVLLIGELHGAVLNPTLSSNALLVYFSRSFCPLSIHSFFRSSA